MAKPHNAYIGNLSPGYEWSVEPHWDDQQGSESQGSGGAALTYATYRDTPFKLFSFRASQSDELHLRFQMPHGWDPTTEVHFHIHTIPLTDPAAAQSARIEGQYFWITHSGVEIPANAGWTTFALDFAIDPGDVNMQKVAPVFHSQPPTDAQESSILLVYVKRSGLDVADTYTGNLAILSLDCHIQRVKIGTLAELPQHG